MAFTAADVGPRIDLLLDGQGYLLDDTQEAKAEFGLSPIFVERQNVQGDYGDAQQDFFLTFTQRDWSLGEQQRFFRQADDDSKRRYWRGTYIDAISTPGRATLNYDVTPLTFAGNVASIANDPITVVAGNASAGSGVIASTATTSYLVAADGTIFSIGAHGLAGTPTRFGTTSDGAIVYITDSASIRKYVLGVGFSAFSAAPASPVSLAFLNNTLFGLSTSALIRYDTAGAATTIFTWKDATGGSLPATTAQIEPFGGKLAILRADAEKSELWLYDGTAAPVLIARLPPGFAADSFRESQGSLFIGGTFKDRPAIAYYTNGTMGILWRGSSSGGTVIAPALVGFAGGILFTDSQAGSFCFYDLANGGTSTVGSYTASGSSPMLAAAANPAGPSFAVHTQAGTAGYLWPATSRASSGSVTTSLIDFESSLTKNFHGVRVEFDAASDGNGGTVDVAYRVGDVDGSYTSLATGITSGSEVLFSGVSGKSISIKVTLNKGTSTSGPVLKRISLRASPAQPQYVRPVFIVACFGTDRSPEPGHMRLRDDSTHPKSGLQMLADLKTAAARQTPITWIDETGTYSGVIEADSFKAQRIRPGEYRVVFTMRSV